MGGEKAGRMNTGKRKKRRGGKGRRGKILTGKKLEET
jgi:hypothetical protein